MADEIAAQSVITRTLGSAGGAATKGGVGVAGVSAMIEYVFLCHDKHMLVHPDTTTEEIMALLLITAVDEIQTWIRNRSGKRRRANDTNGAQSQ